MSLPRLLWSRGADAIEDLIDPIGKPMVRSREDKGLRLSQPLLIRSRGADAIEDLIDPIGKPMVRSREDKTYMKRRLSSPYTAPFLLINGAIEDLIDLIGKPSGEIGGRPKEYVWWARSGRKKLVVLGSARSGRKKLVVLGSGWGAHALLKTLDANKYDVQIVSPRNYFVFTPMLAGAATGTVELRSITESIRSANVGADYLEATAMEIDPERKTISCEAVVCDGGQCSISADQVRFESEGIQG
ncbi:hypothetical protein T484DRAFT_1786417 [Baffinella frigidus]|nr:hypothetical protein T484DRAFT_1786417 [Cryptophyta sp. CCMP2293]